MKFFFTYKKIKTITRVIGAVFVIFLVANTSYAFAATLNNASNDYATLRAMNYTVYGDTNQSWSTSASGNAGETISFAVYYHNTSSETANDVRARFTPQSTGTGTNHQFNGTVWASNATSVSGTSNVFISSSQSMSYLPGTVTWRPNQTVSGSQSLPYGQNGTEIFTSAGLRIGDIAPGWSTQGSVVLRFKISNNVPPPSVSITANPTVINQGNSSVLNWTSNNAISCFASGGWSGTKTLSGNQTVSPSQTTSYSITCSNSIGQQAVDSATVTVNPISNPVPTADIKANSSDGPIFISYNTSANINWTSSNVTSCTVSPIGFIGTSGSQSTGNLISSQTYNLNCSGSYGSVSDSVTVNVGQQPQILPSVTLTANPAIINVGNSSVLNWYSQNANYCNASGGWSGTKLTSGSETVSPSVSTNYTINCYNNSGQASSFTTIYVNGQQTFPTVNISVNPNYIQNGQSTLLVWSSYNATSCYASGGWYGNKSLSGSENVSPSLNTTYTITCSNGTGSVSDTDTVTVTTLIVPPPIIQTFNAACAVSPEVARVGQTVAFAAGYSGGIAPYTYRWNQDISGTGLTRAITFRTTGIKIARVIVTDGTGRTAQGTCSVRVNPIVVVVAPPAPKPKPPVVTIAKTCTCEAQPVQLINASNGTNGKDRSLAASLLLNENGNPTTGGLIIIWYFVILFTVAVGAWIYYLISNRRE